MGTVYDEIKVGDTVIIRSGYGYGYTEVEVVKSLKTQVVVEGPGVAVRYNKRTGREVGGEEDTYRKDQIATMGSPMRLMTVEDLVAMQARKAAENYKRKLQKAISMANLRSVSLEDLETVAEFLGLEVE